MKRFRCFASVVPAVRLREPVASFPSDRSGSIAILAALLLPTLLIVAGGTIDTLGAMQQRTVLQHAVDTAAVAAAREMSLSNSARKNIPQLVNEIARNTIEAQYSDGAAPDGLVVKAKVGGESAEVKVSGSHRFKSSFGKLLGFHFDKISADATAQIVGKPNICVLALDVWEPAAIWLTRSARLTGQECAVFSNSTSSTGLLVEGKASLGAWNTCSAGGATVIGTITPAPYLDCPQFDDPLAGRPEPTAGPCTEKNLVVTDETRTLQPGTYCGGLVIKGMSEVTFEPGLYIIKDKPFIVRGDSSLTGKNVSVFLGKRSWLFFGPDTAISLEASQTGEAAGLLFFGSRSQSKLITHTILSRNAQTLVGTIYMPRNSLVIDGDARVGGDSAYTAIVARRLVLMEGPHLILNSNYDQTDVPVPEGIKGAGQPVRLIE